ncbi:DNA repair protein RAD50, partial [Operophtera brumata]
IYPIQQYFSVIQMNLTLIIPFAIANLSEMLISLERIQNFLVMETKKQLESDREKHIQELQELQDGLAPLQEVLKGKQEAKNETVKKYSSFDKVKAIMQEINQHKDKNIPGEMQKLKEANEKVAEKQKQIAEDKEVLLKKIDELKDELSKQEIEKCEKEDVEINEKLSGINREMLTEKEPLITQHTKLFREKANVEGSLNEMKVH